VIEAAVKQASLLAIERMRNEQLSRDCFGSWKKHEQRVIRSAFTWTIGAIPLGGARQVIAGL
jgi:hypothetical protein